MWRFLSRRFSSLPILPKLTSVDIPKLALPELEKYIANASHAYYNGESLVPDSLFDIAKSELEKRAPKHVLLSQVGSAVANGHKKVKLSYWMGSLDKITTESAVNNFAQKEAGNKFLITDKLDGVSGLLTWSKKKIFLYTRGNGSVGQDVSHIVPYLKIPPFSQLPPEGAVRCELILNKETFRDHWEPGSNARNVVSGLVNSKDAQFNHELIDCVCHEWIVPPSQVQKFTPFEQLLKLESLGFKIPFYALVDNITQSNLLHHLVNRKAHSFYEIDGLVITSNRVVPRNTSGNPGSQVAYKIGGELAVTTVTHVEWTISKGMLAKPIVHFEMRDLGGSRVRRATGNNALFIQKHKIGPGSRIAVTLAGDIIPKIDQVLSPCSSGQASLPDFECTWNATGVDLVADPEKNEAAIAQARIISFFDRIETDGVGSGLLWKLYAGGYKDIHSILTITNEQLLEIPSFKAKTASNVLRSIEAAMAKLTPEKLLVASNTIPAFGLKKSEQLFDKFPQIVNGQVPSVEQLSKVFGKGGKTAQSILEGLPKFFEFVQSTKLQHVLARSSAYISFSPTTPTFTTSSLPPKTSTRAHKPPATPPQSIPTATITSTPHKHTKTPHTPTTLTSTTTTSSIHTSKTFSTPTPIPTTSTSNTSSTSSTNPSATSTSYDPEAKRNEIFARLRAPAAKKNPDTPTKTTNSKPTHTPTPVIQKILEENLKKLVIGKPTSNGPASTSGTTTSSPPSPSRSAPLPSSSTTNSPSKTEIILSANLQDLHPTSSSQSTKKRRTPLNAPSLSTGASSSSTTTSSSSQPWKAKPSPLPADRLQRIRELCPPKSPTASTPTISAAESALPMHTMNLKAASYDGDNEVVEMEGETGAVVRQRTFGQDSEAVQEKEEDDEALETVIDGEDVPIIREGEEVHAKGEGALAEVEDTREAVEVEKEADEEEGSEEEELTHLAEEEIEEHEREVGEEAEEHEREVVEGGDVAKIEAEAEEIYQDEEIPEHTEDAVSKDEEAQKGEEEPEEAEGAADGNDSAQELDVSFQQKHFLFSLFRDVNLDAQIEARGGKVDTSFTKKTNYLVVKSHRIRESVKMKRAREAGVRILSVEELQQAMDQRPLPEGVELEIKESTSYWPTVRKTWEDEDVDEEEVAERAFEQALPRSEVAKRQAEAMRACTAADIDEIIPR